MQKGFVVILILSIIIGIFAISNSGVVAIDFIFTEVLLSQAIVIFICVLLGAIIATIFGWIRQMGLKKEIKELNKENQTLKTEIYESKVQGDKLAAEVKNKEEEIRLLNAKDKLNPETSHGFGNGEDSINQFGVDAVSKFENHKLENQD